MRHVCLPECAFDVVSITKELNDQQKKLENLLEDMKNVVEKSEIAEPLLNRKLYETFREAHQDQADKSLKAAATLLEQKEDALRNNQLLRTLDEIMDKDPDKQKLIDQLRQRDFRQASKILSDQGQRKLNDLKKGVEQAAESVLGNETEALKFAEQQLSELSEALKNEKAEATGKKPNEQAASKPQQGKPGQQKGDPNGEQPNAQNKPAQGDPKANQPNSPNEQAGQPNQKPNPQDQPNQPNQPTPPNSQAQQAGQQPQTGPASFLEKGFNRSERGQNPITGGHHREWTDRLRDVEEAVDRPEVREQARAIDGTGGEGPALGERRRGGGGRGLEREDIVLARRAQRVVEVQKHSLEPHRGGARARRDCLRWPLRHRGKRAWSISFFHVCL